MQLLQAQQETNPDTENLYRNASKLQAQQAGASEHPLPQKGFFMENELVWWSGKTNTYHFLLILLFRGNLRLQWFMRCCFKEVVILKEARRRQRKNSLLADYGNLASFYMFY